MMADPKADSSMDGTICSECNRPVKDHLPEEFAECQRKIDFKKLLDTDGR